jgi:hypothetical protein
MGAHRANGRPPAPKEAPSMHPESNRATRPTLANAELADARLVALGALHLAARNGGRMAGPVRLVIQLGEIGWPDRVTLEPEVADALADAATLRLRQTLQLGIELHREADVLAEQGLEVLARRARQREVWATREVDRCRRTLLFLQVNPTNRREDA